MKDWLPLLVAGALVYSYYKNPRRKSGNCGHCHRQQGPKCNCRSCAASSPSKPGGCGCYKKSYW